MIIVKKLCSYLFLGLCLSRINSITSSLEKETLFWKKSVEKFLNFGSKNLNFASSILQFEKGIIGHDVKCRKPILQHNELVW